MKILGYNHTHDENNEPDRVPSDGGTDKSKARMLTPKDLAALFAVLVLLCASGIAPLPFSFVTVMLAAPLFTVFSCKMGNRFSLFPPIAAFIISFAVTRSAASSVGVLLAAGMAFAMLRAVCQNPENAKTSAVVGCTVVCILCAAAALLLFMLENGIEADYLKEYSEHFFNSLKLYFSEVYGNIDFSSFGIEITESELAAAAEQAAFQAKTLFPAVCVIWSLFIGYISSSLLRPMAKLLKCESSLPNFGKTYEITLSPFAVMIYFISSLGMLLFAGSTAAYGLRNITYILAPGFMLCGIKQIGVFFKSKNIPPMAIIVIQLAAVSVAVMFGNLGVTMLIILGMFYATRINPTKGK